MGVPAPAPWLPSAPPLGARKGGMVVPAPSPWLPSAPTKGADGGGWEFPHLLPGCRPLLWWECHASHHVTASHSLPLAPVLSLGGNRRGNVQWGDPRSPDSSRALPGATCSAEGTCSRWRNRTLAAECNGRRCIVQAAREIRFFDQAPRCLYASQKGRAHPRRVISLRNSSIAV